MGHVVFLILRAVAGLSFRTSCPQAALARAKARVAMAVSWMPVPVRSAMVMSAAARASRLQPGDDLAEFGEVRVAGDEPGVDRVMQFAEPARLLQAVGDVEIGAGDDRAGSISFLCSASEPMAVTCWPGASHSAFRIGCFRRRRGDDDIGAGDRLLRIGVGATRMPSVSRQLRGRGLRLCRIARPDPRLADRPHQRQRLAAAAAPACRRRRSRRPIASSRDRCLAATAPAAAVRTSVR